MNTSAPDADAPQTVAFWRRWLDAPIQHRPLAVLTCGLIALAVAAIFSAVRIPVPHVHDEFSYLLAADTFAKGRLANPTHPHWQHFETFHVIHQPTYASKYQPGQGAMLALGSLVGGHPIVGVWLCTALAAAAVCWMLQGWVPGRWALVGGLLVALHAIIHAQWSLSYWGGALPMAGGALMFGALPRIKRDTHVKDALLLAAGALLLVATRPYEGFVVGVCVSVALIAWLVRLLVGHKGPKFRVALLQFVVPATALLAIGLVALGYYNMKITGDPLRMPYQVHEATYGFSPLFLWQEPRPLPEYRHEVMRDFQTGWAIEDYQQQQTFTGWLTSKGTGLVRVGWFYLWVALCIPLLMLPQLLRSRRLRFAWLTLALFLAAQLMVPWTYAHYFAPAAPLLFLVIVQGLRYLNALPRAGHNWGRLVALTVIALHVIALPLTFLHHLNGQPEDWQWQRAQLASQLENTPGQHLVFVHYGPDHNSHAEWVYNRADIDGAKIVWARELGPERDQALIEYFSERNVWRVEGDEETPGLVTVPDK